MNGKPIQHLPHEPRKPVEITREHPDVIVIEGVRYSGDYFREFGHPDTDMLYAVRRDGDNVWLTQIRNIDEAKKFFEEIYPHPALPQMLPSVGAHLGEEEQGE